MTWARLDDRFDDNRKVKRVWLNCPQALGLHVMALTYCTRHHTDGLVDTEYVAEKAPAVKQRERMTQALVDAGLWTTDPEGWRIHDFLDYNPSSAELAEKRRADAERKARGRATQSAKRPRGVHAESERTPAAVQTASSGPVPTRPIDTTDVVSGARATRAQDDLPTDLPKNLRAAAIRTHAHLTRVAKAKNGRTPTLAATGRVLADFPDHDHPCIAGEFEHYWIHGAGARTHRSDIVLTYRKRVERLAPTYRPDPPAGQQPGESIADLADRITAAHATA